MSGDETDKNGELTHIAVQEMAAKAVKSAMSSFSGTILKAVDDKLSEARTHNPTADISSTKGSRTVVVMVRYPRLL